MTKPVDHGINSDSLLYGSQNTVMHYSLNKIARMASSRQKKKIARLASCSVWSSSSSKKSVSQFYFDLALQNRLFLNSAGLFAPLGFWWLMALRIPSSSCLTTICRVRKMASFARVHRKPDAQQFGVTSTTLPFTLFCWTGHLYPTICSAQKDSLAIFILKSQPSQCSLFGRICISIASAKFSGPQKIGFTRERAPEYIERKPAHFFLLRT